MFAVYRVVSDGCTYVNDILLFVTENEQTAEDAVTLAELELEAAYSIKEPTWTSASIGAGLTIKVLKEQRDEYQAKIRAMFTVDKFAVGDGCIASAEYRYEAVEVR